MCVLASSPLVAVSTLYVKLPTVGNGRVGRTHIDFFGGGHEEQRACAWWVERGRKVEVRGYTERRGDSLGSTLRRVL